MPASRPRATDPLAPAGAGGLDPVRVPGGERAVAVPARRRAAPDAVRGLSRLLAVRGMAVGAPHRTDRPPRASLPGHHLELAAADSAPSCAGACHPSGGG